jgi:hypothetical protein
MRVQIEPNHPTVICQPPVAAPPATVAMHHQRKARENVQAMSTFMFINDGYVSRDRQWLDRGRKDDTLGMIVTPYRFCIRGKSYIGYHLGS